MVLCNDRVMLCKDGVVLCNVSLPCSIYRYSVIPLSQNLELIGWVPHSDTLHIVIRDYRECGAQAHVAGGHGWGRMKSEGVDWRGMG